MLITMVLLLMAMVFNVMAQLVLKSAVMGFQFNFGSLNELATLLGNIKLWIGALIYGGSFVVYIFALSRGDLSKIGPVSQALTILGLFLVSSVVFHETVTPLKVIGLIFLMIGIAAISFG